MQQDLFQVTSVSNSPFETQGSILEKYRISLRLDHVLILMIILVIAYSFVYSVGVEKGKKSSISHIHAATERIQQELQVKQSAAGSFAQESVAAAEKQPVQAKLEDAAQIKTSPEVAVTVPEVVIDDGPSRLDPAPAKRTPPRAVGIEGKAKPEGRYTVQLVTYNKEELAKKQLRELSEKGYQGFVVPTGKYLQICVNAFDSRRAASRFLSHLKDGGIAPGDAYVRNMPA